jgi:hypothetical protein
MSTSSNGEDIGYIDLSLSLRLMLSKVEFIVKYVPQAANFSEALESRSKQTNKLRILSLLSF